jgi:ribonuclease HII
MIGVDEVGRGAWAGPLLVCATRLHEPIQGLRDSKLLSAKRREQLSEVIRPVADIGYGWVPAQEIDFIGLAAALRLATKRALTSIKPMSGEQIIIDGTINFAPEFGATTLVKADQTISEVSAASIVAKVARDEYMIKLSTVYPEYGFGSHVGYGTALHQRAIQMHGLCAEHRKSFNIHNLGSGQ